MGISLAALDLSVGHLINELKRQWRWMVLGVKAETGSYAGGKRMLLCGQQHECDSA